MIAFLSFAIIGIPVLVILIIWTIIKYLINREKEKEFWDWYYKDLGVGPGERFTADTYRRLNAWKYKDKDLHGKSTRRK